MIDFIMRSSAKLGRLSACGGVALIYLFRKLPGVEDPELQNASRRAEIWETIAGQERASRQDYERALGLSFWSERKTDEELWERAHQGDQISIEILEARTRRAGEESLHWSE